MNLAALRENPRALKRRWRVAKREDGASLESRGRGDDEAGEVGTATRGALWDCPLADPVTEETSPPEATGEPPASTSHTVSREHDGSERMEERRTDPDRPTGRRTHPASTLSDLGEVTHTGADGESAL